MKIKRGSTSVRRLLFIGDSSSTTGAGLANLAHNTASLVAWYFAGDLSNDLQITLASATLGTYTSGGFVAVDNTNMPGWYELGIPNAVLDGGNEVAIQLRGAANMLPVNIYIELDSFDYQTATQPVNVTQFGGSNGVFSSGRPEVNTTNLAGQSVTAEAGVTFPTSVASPTNITAATGVVLSATTHTGAVIPWNAAWDAEVQSECTAALNAYDPPTKTEQDAAFNEIKGAGWSSSTDTLAKIKVDTAVGRSAGVVTIGVISNAGTAVESYTYGGQTVAFTGLDASGNRSGVTVS